MEIKTKLSIGDAMYIIEKTEYDKPITVGMKKIKCVL